MTIAAFLNPDRADKWLESMEDLGYAVTETKVSPSGPVLVLEKPAVAEAAL